MRLVVIGTGYVGLVTALALAEMGHVVCCLDVDQSRIKQLQEGKMPFFEPGVAEVLERNIKEKRIYFTTSYTEALKGIQLVMLAVNTPQGESGQSDLSYLFKAVESLVEHMDSSVICIVKSTVPPGTCHRIVELVKGHLKKYKKEALSFDIVSNPEFLKQGDALNDCMKPDRIVVGIENPSLREIMEELYAPFNRSSDRVIWMDIVSAELAKYACNAILATRISFMNEIARLCEAVGGDVEKVRKVMGSDHRIGPAALYPGLGYGGSCFPKDLQALAFIARQHNSPLSIIEATQQANQLQRQYFVKKILKFFNGSLKNKKIAIWGVAFKPGTDDLREAPAIYVIEELAKAGAHLNLFDPVALERTKEHPTIKKYLHQLSFSLNEQESVEGVDAIVLCTEWKQFRLLDFSALAEKMHSRVLFDGRNQYRPKELQSKGFTYISIGR